MTEIGDRRSGGKREAGSSELGGVGQAEILKHLELGLGLRYAASFYS